jgi:hypothetical protein
MKWLIENDNENERRNGNIEMKKKKKKNGIEISAGGEMAKKPAE